MTRSVNYLVTGYVRISKGEEASNDPKISACIFHDIADYEIQNNHSESELVKKLSAKFFAHLFIQSTNELISLKVYFGRIKEGVICCTDVPVPSRRK